jgi:hypothetical protein
MYLYTSDYQDFFVGLSSKDTCSYLLKSENPILLFSLMYLQSSIRCTERIKNTIDYTF